MRLKWKHSDGWGAAITRPPVTFIIVQDWGPAERWTATMKHVGGQTIFLGSFPDKEAAQQACQHEADQQEGKWKDA